MRHPKIKQPKAKPTSEELLVPLEPPQMPPYNPFESEEEYRRKFDALLEQYIADSKKHLASQKAKKSKKNKP
jgi:hypothetical protein